MEEMKPPQISIITVVFNAAEDLQRTIDSVRMQTGGSYEYIIVDGVSTDGTLDVIKANEDVVAKYVTEPDRGIYDAMNKGIQLARGTYVWFMNAGDIIYNEEVIADIFEDDQGADIYYGDAEIVDFSGKKIGLRRLRPPTKLTWKSFRYGMLVSHQAIIVRKEICDLFNLEYTISADIDWVINALKNSRKTINTGKILTKYQQKGFSRKHIPRALRERFRIMVEHYGLLTTLLSHIVITFKFLFFFLRNRWF